jgi:HPr kinase/phosphorylase
MAKPLSVGELFQAKREILALELLTSEEGLNRTIESPEIGSPGLVLTGYTERFPSGRLQVLGETEITFLSALDDERRQAAVELFLSFAIPAVFITKGLEPPDVLLRTAEERGIPLIRSAVRTTEFYARTKPFLEERMAPSTTLHGSLADVYGVGLLFVGKSGIGKSEAVLDLIERGHRLVADDMVLVSRRGQEVLIGRGHELQRHHMEIRGVGIIDIPALFGVRSVRLQKRLEVVVQLEAWDEKAHYDRTGLDRMEQEILGVTIPKVIVPLNPGKNITVIAEVVAMNHLLKYAGVDSAQQFDQKLRDRMQGSREYLEEDYE